MGFYDRHILPHLIECACGMGDVMKARSQIVPRARGRVLEIGIGTGLNLSFYDASKVQHICGVDPAAQMHPLAQRRAQAIAIPVETLPLVIEQIDDPHAEELTIALRLAGFDVERSAAIRELQWSKLLINLNNSVSALSDRPTQEIVLSQAIAACSPQSFPSRSRSSAPRGSVRQSSARFRSASWPRPSVCRPRSSGWSRERS